MNLELITGKLRADGVIDGALMMATGAFTAGTRVVESHIDGGAVRKHGRGNALASIGGGDSVCLLLLGVVRVVIVGGFVKTMDLGFIASKGLSGNLENGAEAVAAYTLAAILGRCIVRDRNVEAAAIVVVVILIGLVAVDVCGIALQIFTGRLEDGTFAGATRTLTAVFGLGGRRNFDVEAHGKLIGLFALPDGLDPFAFGVIKGLLVVVIIVVAMYLERIANKFLAE